MAAKGSSAIHFSRCRAFPAVVYFTCNCIYVQYRNAQVFMVLSVAPALNSSELMLLSIYRDSEGKYMVAFILPASGSVPISILAKEITP